MRQEIGELVPIKLIKSLIRNNDKHNSIKNSNN